MHENIFANWEASPPGYTEVRDAERNAGAQELFGKSFSELDMEQRIAVGYHLGGLHRDYRRSWIRTTRQSRSQSPAKAPPQSA
ncbi:hypothetical protein PLESTB_000343600 [Pleodorina starrii]|uniref:Uncharacterized protein n=1 Tax=Pleodorina starrii TaxID=330485 RepID=A0A9W6EZ10_9CHLO|nr:hypothetical protein PLESTB_000343600 [Pleodorina starrii]GLC73105.1 hypothetical protein PLESTF_001332700 [Pleodorina starrii]